jgi:hypothetical protein
MSTQAGPALEALVRRIVETPADFREEPRCGGRGRVHVDAVIADLALALGTTLDPATLDTLGAQQGTDERNRLSIVLLQAWLLAEPALGRAAWTADELKRILGETARELAPHTSAPRFVDDVERREELARVTLSRLGLHPQGETAEQAQDRLTSLSAAERARVMAATRAAQERARLVREALARKEAEESADKYTRE